MEDIYPSFALTAQKEGFEDIAEEKITISRNKRIEVVPMSAEEAVLQMNLTSHDFFVYKNDKDAKINIVYKRYDGGYGLLEVE